MSGNIRKQLGPVRKRLHDRIAEATLAVQDGDQSKIKSVRSRLLANNASHDGLIKKLEDVTNNDADEQIIIDNELESGATLSMDAVETLQLLDDCIDNTDDKAAVLKSTLSDEKMQMELENLKLESDYKRAQIKAVKSGTGGRKDTIKLPKISWPSFWDAYKATIHNNQILSKVDKFKYLMSCLHGEARESLTGFTIGEGQYDQAIKLLEEIYDDKEFIIHSYYETLSDMQKSKNSTVQLRQTLNLIETQLRSLEALGEDVENKHVVAIIKNKFPSEFNLKLEETREEEWTVAVLRKKIRKLIVAREKSEQSWKANQEDVVDVDDDDGEFLLSKDVKLNCVYCGRNHWHDECQKYKTLQQRKMQIKGRCFICLSTQHFFRQCKSDKPCYLCRWKGNHHTSLCPSKFDESKMKKEGNEKAQEEGKEKGIEKEEKDDADIGDAIMINIGEKIVMKTAKVSIKNPRNGRRLSGVAMLDTGAKHTYVTAEMARLLGVDRGPSQTVRLSTFGNTSPTEVTTNQTSFQVHQTDGSYKRINARICKNITGQLTRSKIPLEKYKNIWSDLKLADDLPVKDTTMKLDILIGNDYYDEIMKSDKLKIDNGLYLVNSSLGWIFSGRIPGADEQNDDHVMFIEEEYDASRAFWDLESIGVKDVDDNLENQQAVDSFERTIIKDKGRYEVSWPWKLSKYELPSNYSLAEARLRSLMRNFKNEETKREHNDIIQKQLEDGIVEEADCTKEYLQKPEVVTHYLPHHAVISEDGANKKLRIVYEGCAKTNNSAKSLNNCLHRGPNLVANLGGVLLRFRMNKIALIADIKKAYLQLQLNPFDRDVTRFLWVKDIYKEVSRSNIRELRFTRVIWGIIAAAFLLAFTLLYHLTKYQTPVVRKTRMKLLNTTT